MMDAKSFILKKYGFLEMDDYDLVYARKKYDEILIRQKDDEQKQTYEMISNVLNEVISKKFVARWYEAG